jgi:hypothetical protein
MVSLLISGYLFALLLSTYYCDQTLSRGCSYFFCSHVIHDFAQLKVIFRVSDDCVVQSLVTMWFGQWQSLECDIL